MDAGLVLVENDDWERALYGEWLHESGYAVREAASGLEALELARAEPPAAIVLNLDLPGLDGCETARVLRRDERLRGVRIVALTGPGANTSAGDARSAGCDAFVPVPVERSALLAAVRRVLRTRWGAR
jgi:CheY-like chemotaxis protein